MVELEPAIPACEQPKTHAFDLAITGISYLSVNYYYFLLFPGSNTYCKM